MLSFENDYNRGAHPEILRRFIETNMDMEVGYGNDSFCDSAKEKIRAACGCPDADEEKNKKKNVQQNSLFVHKSLLN